MNIFLCNIKIINLKSEDSLSVTLLERNGKFTEESFNDSTLLEQNLWRTKTQRAASHNDLLWEAHRNKISI